MHGIGGHTLAEARERISYPEFLTWCAFRRKRGTLNPGLRIDRAAALLASLYVNAHSKDGKHTLYDFTPYEEAPPVSLDEAMKSWS